MITQQADLAKVSGDNTSQSLESPKEKLDPNLILPAQLIAKLDAASNIEEVKRVVMDYVNTSLSFANMAIAATTSLDKKTQAILVLRQSTVITAHGERLCDLQGRKIGRSDAAEKYGIAPVSIIRWERQLLADKNPLVRVYEKGFGRGKQVQVDEGHVAAVVALSNQLRTDGQQTGPMPGLGKYPPRKRKAS